jgi:DNA-binding beta-propeller fold protein YncE
MRVLAVSFGALFLSLALRAADGPYMKLAEIKIGGGSGWDYLHVDAEARRLYVTHGAEINVIDIDKDTLVGKIAVTPGVHGFLAVNDLGRGFSSNGTENKSSVVDLRTLTTLQKIDTGGNPDAMAYDAKNQEIYTFNGRGSATIFNAKTLKVVETALALGGKPVSGAVDTGVGRVYVNIEDKNEVAVIDTKTHTVVARWPIAPGTAATGMAEASRAS